MKVLQTIQGGTILSSKLVYQSLNAIFVLCICTSLYYAILTSSVAAWLGLQVRYDSVLLPVGLAGVFALLARMPNRLAMAAVLLVPVGLCGLVLSGVWYNYISDMATLAGSFPHSDGRSYLEGGLSLLNRHELSAFASRRPLSVLFWAFLLAVGGINIKICMALMVFLCAIVIGLSVRLVIKIHGWVAGYVVFLSLFFFYRRFVGTFLTEHLGFALGCLGFALIWLSLFKHRKSLAATGLLMLTLALNIRAGAFFILPTLVLWAGWNWRGKRCFSLNAFAITCLAVGVGFGLNSLALQTVGQAGASQGNFCYTLYGLVHGGDWTQALQDHPEVAGLPEEERNQAIYDLALARIATEPSSLVSGAAKAYKVFFFSSQGPFSFVFFSLQQSILKYPLDQIKLSRTDKSAMWQAVLDRPWKYLQIAATFITYGLLFFLTVLGWILHFKRKLATTKLLIFAWSGVLASVPFLPPWDADMMRVYAATIPFLIILPALGLSSLFLRRNTAGDGLQEHLAQNCQYELLGLSGGIALLFIILPIAFKPHAITVPTQDLSCESGEQPWELRFVRGSKIYLRSNDEKSPQAENESTISNIRENMGVLFVQNPHRAEAFFSFSDGQTLALGWERFSKRMRYLVLEKDLSFVDGQSWVRVCSSPFYQDNNTTWWRIRAAGR